MWGVTTIPVGHQPNESGHTTHARILFGDFASDRYVGPIFQKSGGVRKRYKWEGVNLTTSTVLN